MPETPQSFARGGIAVCAACGQRPGTMRVVVATRNGPTPMPLCERCARELMASGAAMAPADAPGRNDQPQSKTPALDEFGRDLTAEARQGRIDPVIGREDEIEQTVEILARRRKNNAVLIGEAGVGKTAIVEGLARRIAEGDVPATLSGTRVVALDMSGMVAGAQYRGQFEQRMKTVLEEIAASEGRVVVFIDELHTILGAGNAEGAMDAANMLKPMLARGELRMIGATTLAEYRKIERDGALARRFSPVTVEEPSVDDTVAILRGLREAYENHHEATITDEALEAAARLSDRYVTEYHLPDKALDLVDQAAAKVRLRNGPTGADAEALRTQLAELDAEKDAAVAAEAYENAAELKVRAEQLRERLQAMDSEHGESHEASETSETSESAESTRPVVGETDIAAVVAARTGIPVGELVAGELERLHTLEADLHERVIGQEDAVELVADTVRRARVGLAEGDRPLGTFLFLGPTGVGKTELVKALAQRLFASDKALVRIDMSEYREPHTVARLIGSPPGYVGYGEGGQLSEPVRRRPYSVILLDEIEKAHPDVWNVLLQVMDDGRLTDGEGRTVDFSNTVLVMTSNLGAAKAKRAVGFTAAAPEADAERMRSAAKSAFLPEFLNRIDEIVTFSPLTAEQVERIGALMCAQVADRLREERGIELEVDEALLARLARDGFDEEFGARPLKRHIRRTLEKALTRAILTGELADGATVRARRGDEGDGIVLDTISAPALEPAQA
ncbi:MAG: ATP-dependent Clp protease ATP-binding subunit ClpC [Solirubrobacteraceae bacterium]|jgi:ATP-dependent Clp protease ATP-binding subunit ClpC|nr:ATP-dependent Clp protease ATP-binding subunit ClpC [Solirubrobacteraceae bacterium]